MYCQSESTKKITPAFEPNPFPEPRTIPTGWDMSNYLDDADGMFVSPESDMPVETDQVP